MSAGRRGAGEQPGYVYVCTGSPRRAVPVPVPGREGAAPAEDAQRCPGGAGRSVGPPREHRGGRGQLWPSSAPPRAPGLRGRPGQEGPGGSAPVCRVGGDRPGTEGPVCPGSASGVTAGTPTHSIPSHRRIEGEQQPAPGGSHGWVLCAMGCCLWSWAGAAVTV